VNQYFIHSRMRENWGYLGLAKQRHEASIGETKAADRVMKRTLYLDGVPNMQRLNPIRAGEGAVEQHRLDLELEKPAIARYNKAIALCAQKGDKGTRDLPWEILRVEEHGADSLESQLRIANEIGKKRYLAEQIHAERP